MLTTHFYVVLSLILYLLTALAKVCLDLYVDLMGIFVAQLNNFQKINLTDLSIRDFHARLVSKQFIYQQGQIH